MATHFDFSTTTTLAPASSLSQVERLANYITSLIVDGVLPAGARINISRLAKEYGSSAIPVREALARLVVSGSVNFTPNLGYQVAKAISDEEVVKLYEARQLIETSVAANVIVRCSKADIEELRQINEELKRLPPEALRLQRYRRFFEINNEFHYKYVSINGNKYIDRTYAALCFDILVGRRALDFDLDFDVLFAEHDALIAALQAGSLEQLNAAIKGHIDTGVASYLTTSD
jgi:DNA-binding GntR family transcriptional regulator